MTTQRRVILEELKKVRTHPTAEEVHAMVRKRIPAISLGTVYRNLEIMFDSGVVERIRLGGSRRRYDGFTEGHYHIRCVECGRVDDVPGGTSDEVEKIIGRVSHYKIIGHRLGFLGMCRECLTAPPVSGRAAGCERETISNAPLKGRKGEWIK